MDKKLAEAIVEACENQGLDVSVNEVYSGRGMYGDTTFAVETGSGVGMADILLAVICNADLFCDPDDYDAPLFDNCRGLRSDSLGLGIVIY